MTTVRSRRSRIRCAVIAAALLALNSGCPRGDPTRPAGAEGQRLPFSSGRITYAVKGRSASGMSTFSWIEDGRRFRQEVTLTITIDKERLTSSAWSVGDATHIFAHQDWMDKEVFRYRLPQDLQAGSPIGLPVFGTARDPGKVVGTATVLGKPCEIHERKKLRLWIWQGLPLKADGTEGPGPSLTLSATKLEPSERLPNDLFTVPEGYTVSDFPLQAQPDAAGNQ